MGMTEARVMAQNHTSLRHKGKNGADWPDGREMFLQGYFSLYSCSVRQVYTDTIDERSASSANIIISEFPIWTDTTKITHRVLTGPLRPCGGPMAYHYRRAFPSEHIIILYTL